MRTLVFSSCLGPQMTRFCRLRRLAGTDYDGQVLILKYFDRFLVEQNFVETCLTADLIDRYMRGISHLAPRTQSNRLSVIRQFSYYLGKSRPESYIPETTRCLSSESTFQPYIFTVKEICSLITLARRLGPSSSLRGATLAMLYGLLFTTGIRIGEALALNIEDFSPDALMLEIRKGKFRKQRLVPITVTTGSMLQHYVRQRLDTSSLQNSSPLFINIRGRRLSHLAASVPFNSLLRQSGIYTGSGQKPRLHDLRHSFAVQRLLQWYQEGGDINRKLPYLATYMGHVNIRSTQVYLHATPQLKQQANQLALSYFRTHVLGSAQGGQ